MWSDLLSCTYLCCATDNNSHYVHCMFTINCDILRTSYIIHYTCRQVNSEGGYQPNGYSRWRGMRNQREATSNVFSPCGRPWHRWSKSRRRPPVYRCDSGTSVGSWTPSASLWTYTACCSETPHPANSGKNKMQWPASPPKNVYSRYLKSSLFPGFSWAMDFSITTLSVNMYP